MPPEKPCSLHYTVFAAVLLLIFGCNSDSNGDPNDAGDDTDSASPDAGAPDAGEHSIELWDWCPDVDAYQGDRSWPWSVEVTQTALYCAGVDDAEMDDPDGALVASLARKAQIRFVPGTYPLPSPETTESDLSLPLCHNTAEDTNRLAMHDSGTVSVESYDTYIFSNPGTSEETLETVHRYTYRQPFTGNNSETKQFSVTLETVNYDAPSAMTLTLNGRYSKAYCTPEAPLFVRISYQPEQENRPFYPCVFFDRPSGETLTTIEFSQGTVNFDMDIYSNLPESDSTEPSAFVRAFGTYKGVSFSQDDYWKLVYAPTHHHFSQSFAVIFDTPIADACGLKLTDYDPMGLELTPKLSAIDCELNDIETFEISQ